MLKLGLSLGLRADLLPVQTVNTLIFMSKSFQLQLGSLWGSESLNRVLCCRNEAKSHSTGRLIVTFARLTGSYLLVTPTHLIWESGMERRGKKGTAFCPYCALGQGRRRAAGPS